MSTVWYAIPSKRPPDEAERVLKLWRERGYHVALWRDDASEHIDAELVQYGPYPGYAQAVNHLCRYILKGFPNAEWIVTGGDDVEPDPNHSAEEIARGCSEYFANLRWTFGAPDGGVTHIRNTPTFGVMQPTGDPWSDTKGRIIERIAGSPWMGREFCRRMNGGAGPLWPEYTHCFEDEELQCVAQKLGVFWQRSDLIQYHNQWARESHHMKAKMPDFLAEANSPQHWARFKSLFEIRKAGGFPGHEPIP